MPLEIETKIKVDDLAPIRARLLEISATSLGRVLETNTFLDTPDRALLGADCGLRVRESRDPATGVSTHALTYKGPRQAGMLKTREERELSVSSSADVIGLFEALGFVIVLAFEKRRESWKLGECKVELDELPLLGTFVEVEGPGESAVKDGTRKLGLADRPHLSESYIAMLMERVEKQVVIDRVIRFS